MNKDTFEVFYDGECPLCVKEINILRRFDRKERIIFTDISDSGFDAKEETGRSYEELMAVLHGRTPRGEMIEGVEVLRQLYSRVGLKPFIWITRLPGISELLNLGYHVFAKNRLRLTGRCEDKECDVDYSTS